MEPRISLLVILVHFIWITSSSRVISTQAGYLDVEQSVKSIEELAYKEFDDTIISEEPTDEPTSLNDETTEESFKEPTIQSAPFPSDAPAASQANTSSPSEPPIRYNYLQYNNKCSGSIPPRNWVEPKNEMISVCDPNEDLFCMYKTPWWSDCKTCKDDWRGTGPCPKEGLTSVSPTAVPTFTISSFPTMEPTKSFLPSSNPTSAPSLNHFSFITRTTDPVYNFYVSILIKNSSVPYLDEVNSNVLARAIAEVINLEETAVWIDGNSTTYRKYRDKYTLFVEISLRLKIEDIPKTYRDNIYALNGYFHYLFSSKPIAKLIVESYRMELGRLGMDDDEKIILMESNPITSSYKPTYVPTQSSTAVTGNSDGKYTESNAAPMSNKWLVAIVVLGVFLLVLVIIIFYLRSRRNKMEEFFDLPRTLHNIRKSTRTQTMVE